MIKVAELVKRPAGMTVDDFQQHWLENHGPIVARIPGLRRYVQSHPLLGGYRSGELVFDGLAELWFDDKAALAAIASTPEFAAAKADEPNFVDGVKLIELVVDEHIIRDVEPPADAIKSIELLTFRDDIEPDDARTHWRGPHAKLASKIPGLTRYVQSPVRPGAYRDGARPAYDGMAVTWFASTDVMRSIKDQPETLATRADEPNFLAPGLPPVLLTKEHMILG